MTEYTVCQTTRCRKYANLDENGYCSVCVEKQKKLDSDVIPYPCKTCGKNCTDLQSCMQCDLCLEWNHAVCLDISDEAYQLLRTLKGTRWFCSKCTNKVDQLIEKANTLEIETKAVKADVEDLKTRMENVEKKLKGSVHKEISVAINEKADIERRKMNLVIFNLPEQKCANDNKTAWELPEIIEKDIETITNIIKNELKIDLGENIITDARRLGRKQNNNEEKPKARPIKIKFSDLRKKREVLEAAKKFRTSENDIAKHLFINPDLTEAQREKDRELRKLMWERRGNGENVAIQRGEIVTVEHPVRKIRANNTKNADKPKPSASKGPQ